MRIGHRRRRLTVERWAPVLEAAGFSRVGPGVLAWESGTHLRGDTYLLVDFYTQERRCFERRGIVRVLIFYWPDWESLGSRRLERSLPVEIVREPTTFAAFVRCTIAYDRERVMREFPPHG